MSKREIVVAEWNRAIELAENRLADSTKCFELFGESTDKDHMEEDQKRLDELKKQFSDVLRYMDARGVS